MPRKPRRTSKGGTVTFETARQLALALPGAEEGTSYGTPAFKVRGKLFARLHQDGDALVVRIDSAEQVLRMQADPKAFFITDHYLNYPWMLVRFAAVHRDDLRDLLEESWRQSARRGWSPSTTPRGAPDGHRAATLLRSVAKLTGWTTSPPSSSSVATNCRSRNSASIASSAGRAFPSR